VPAERGRHHVEEAEQPFHGVLPAARVGRLQFPADADQRLAEQRVLVGVQRRGRHDITRIVLAPAGAEAAPRPNWGRSRVTAKDITSRGGQSRKS
jgi:hypothetical protein